MWVRSEIMDIDELIKKDNAKLKRLTENAGRQLKIFNSSYKEYFLANSEWENNHKTRYISIVIDRYGNIDILKKISSNYEIIGMIAELGSNLYSINQNELPF